MSEMTQDTDGQPTVPTTGHPQVDAALAPLASLPDLPVAEHVEVFESAHTQLREALNDAGRPA